jgi:hypothetical protein
MLVVATNTMITRFRKRENMNIKDNPFEAYIGLKVLVTETKRTLNIGGIDYNFEECAIQDGDTVVNKLCAEIKTAGFLPRTWLPGSMGTMDYRTDRVNIRIEKKNDGSFEIVSTNIG